MKKIITLCLLSCLLCISGCNNNDEDKQLSNNDNIVTLPDSKDDMVIKPTEFSEETKEVLELFDEEIQFFDIIFNETVKSHKISVWVYRDGEWKEEGKIFGEVEFLANRNAIRLTDTSFELYSIDDSGHSKYKYPSLDTEFDKTTSKIWWKLDYKKEIQLNEEIVLWTLIGSNKTEFETSIMGENFREIECDTGIVITITLSDEALN